ncbi:MAG: acetate--CoA ligase family protein [Ramlibacter sp.]|nr:acetate--CoA ligase family protein [Ramlibacter sp.]
MTDPTAQTPIEPVRISSTWHGLRGHAHGLRGPVLIGNIRCSTTAQWKTEALAALLRNEGGLDTETVERCLAGNSLIDAFFALILALERAGQSPVSQTGIVLSQPEAAPGSTEWRVAIPGFHPRFTQETIGWLATAINLCNSTSEQAQRDALIATMNTRLETARGTLQGAIKSGGVNAARIARACAEMNLPMQLLPRGYVHVGSGANALIFNSTMTEATTALGVALARSKSVTASLLALRGLPVPKHRLVKSAQDAVKVASELGYPVVVKPDDRDGGLGVNAGLMTAEQVTQCYEQAVAISPNVLVETHVAGQDFRITVDNGRVVKVIGRQAGGVLGDGGQTIAQLVAEIAAGKPALRGTKSILSIDAEALELLVERGMTAASVPPAGEFVVLRRRANMSTGGTSRDAMADMHPDNARLAIRAAESLRLDLAGIDLIIPDISVSWMNCTAAICEVNAQPQISTEFAPNVYRDLLTRMLREPSRLHAVVLLNPTGKADCDSEVALACAELAARGERVLSVRTDGTWIGDVRIAPANRGVVVSAIAGELEKSATAAVISMTPKQLLQNGLPWLHVDEVRVLPGADAADAALLRECLELVAPHVAGQLKS